MYPTGRVPQYEYVGTAATTVVNAGPTFLHSITVTGTQASTITVYDHASGSGTVVALLKASIVEATYTFDVMCAIGLTIITAGESKFTVSYIPMD